MLVIHHWDTDGITSAALTIKALGLDDFINIVPPIGEFRFDGRIKKHIEEAEKVYILDLNLPQEVEDVEKDTVFIDHHLQKKIKNPKVRQVNPILERMNGKEFPSASFVVSNHFSLWNSWSSLGAVGDIGNKAFEIPKTLELLKTEGLTKNEALKLVQLIDSNYITMDRSAAEKAVELVLNRPLKELLEYEPWIKNLEEIERTIKDVLSGIEVKNDIAFIEYSSPFNIISKIARKAVWEMGYNGAVVLNRSFHEKAQLYFRISPDLKEKIDMEGIIQILKNRGFNAGGKSEVLGIIFEKNRIDEVLGIINGYLASL